jgi:hypothetical protein
LIKSHRAWKPSDTRFCWAGWVIWATVAVILGVKTASDHERRTVTTVYYEATQLVLDGANPYESGAYHYPPHFASFYTPFHALGRPAGDVAWRWLGIACLGASLWMMAGRLTPGGAGRLFFWATVLSMPLCLSAMRNGQANTIFAAMLLFSAFAMSRASYATAALGFGLATAVKHLSAPMVLLGCVSHPRMIPRALIVFAVWAALPYLLLGTDQAGEQYRSFLSHATSLASGQNELAGVTEHRFADINGIVRSLGYELPRVWFVLAAVVAALGAAVYWHSRARRIPEPARALLLLAISVCYLMLFNPMNESNSYIIAAPAIALIAVNTSLFRHSQALQWVLISSMLVISFVPEMLRPLTPTAQLWLKPTAALVWAIVIVVFCEREASGSPSPNGGIATGHA